MSNLSYHYSHAAPAIREAAIHALRRAKNARTIRDRQAYKHEAFAFMTALSIMKSSGDQAPAPGIMNVEQLPGWKALVDEFLGSYDAEGYGFVDVEEVPA